MDDMIDEVVGELPKLEESSVVKEHSQFADRFKQICTKEL
jgi:hypothetical protein